MNVIREVSKVAARELWGKHVLGNLPYDYVALEPIISRDIMYIHHTKHHNGYVNNLNIAEEKLRTAIENGDISTVISLNSALKFNGGGHLNHSIFWHNLTAEKTEPSSELSAVINETFGSMEDFKKQLAAQTNAIQGSGWGWLGYCPNSKRIKITTCANQDPLQATTGIIPLLGIDVWEHAYYLQYKNMRAEYVYKIFDIVNWANVSQRFEDASSS